MYEYLVRTLTEKEIRYCKARMSALEKKAQPTFSIILKQIMVGFGIAALICLLGYLSSKDKPPAWFFMLIFLLPGTIWTVWFSRDSIKEQRQIKNSLLNLRDALSYGKARVERVRSERMIEIEEREDEGACYLFEVEPKKLFLLHGQEYYASSKFPSSDFSLIDILDSNENCISSIVEKEGNKLKPYRSINAKSKVKDLIPYEEKFLECGIDEVEEYLTSHGRCHGI